MFGSEKGGRQFRLLTLHCVLWSLAMSLASGFVGAFLLRHGFSLASTILLYAGLLATRFGMRALILPLVRRLGTGRAMLLGTATSAFQFLPLIHADRPAWLLGWLLIVSTGECIYWPICHAANAVCGGHGQRGKQVAIRQMASTTISVAGPVAGGFILTQIGPAVEFGVATVLCLLSAAPLLIVGRLDLGAVPTIRRSFQAADLPGMCAFAADGWMCAGTGIAWQLILFSSLGATYDALGWAGSSAGIAGALAGLGCGVAIDRGHRKRLSPLVTAGLLLAVLLRVASGWAPWAAFAANMVGAAAGGAYYPVLMSMVYDRAKRSGSAYQFHLAAEAGWYMGAMLGCCASAAIILSGLPVTLAVMPAVIGVLLVQRCVGTEGRQPPSKYAARISGRASNSAPEPAMVIAPLTRT